MFDLGFTELLLIGVVALLVVGPERLPKVARTAGHLLGRFQRYVASVKSDISREVQLEELRKAGQSFKESVENTAFSIQNRVADEEYALREEVVSPVEKVIEALGTTEGSRPVTEQEVNRIRAEEQAAQDNTAARQSEINFDAPQPSDPDATKPS